MLRALLVGVLRRRASLVGVLLASLVRVTARVGVLRASLVGPGVLRASLGGVLLAAT